MRRLLTNTKFIQDNKFSSFSFLSKITYFGLIGGSGFILNYVICYLFSSGIICNWWYIQASLLGISVSMTTNFILNKIFTFKDTNFALSHLFRQYAFYILFTAIGAVIQIINIYFF